MSDVIPAVVTVPVSTVASSAPVVQPDPFPSPPAADKDPNWLPARLERERKAMLKDLGVEDVKDVKAALDELKTRRAAEMTESERMRVELDELKSKTSRVTELESVVKSQADYQLASLNDAQKSTISALAGDDPAKIIATIDRLKSAGMLSAPVVAPQASVAPANTAAVATPKSPATPQTVDHLKIWESLQEKHPFHAAAYLDRHEVAIVAAKANKAK